MPRWSYRRSSPREEWQQAHEALLAKEKQATRERDALAAERRRQPMLEFGSDYEFEGPDGVVRLPDLFEGRPQLILYHFWFPEDGAPCGGCSMFTDQLPQLAHLNARDVTFATVSTAPQDQIAALKERMGWEMPWYTVVGEEFQQALRDERVLRPAGLHPRRRPRVPHL